MATQLSPLSASVTRILSLTGFPPELKTRDIHAAFQEWESVNGGFKIKWIDDTSLFVVFADAIVAKRAYLQTLASPPAIFTSPTSDTSATIRPYDGPDAQTVIQAVNSRGGPGAHRTRSSVSGPLTLNGLAAHARAASGAGVTNGGGKGSPPQGQLVVSPTSARREPSPTLPSIPNQPTLNSLISSSLSPELSPTEGGGKELEAATSPTAGTGTPPRIGDAGKRMMGAALGIRHPGITPRATASDMRDVQKAMTGLNVGAD